LRKKADVDKSTGAQSSGLTMATFFKGFLVVAISFTILRELPWFVTPIGWLIVPAVIQKMVSKSMQDGKQSDEPISFTGMMQEAKDHLNTLFGDELTNEDVAAEEFKLAGQYGPKARTNEALQYQERSKTLLPSWVQKMEPGLKKWIAMIDWIHMIVLFVIPAWGFYGVSKLETFHPTTVKWAIAYYCFTGLGITAGYHRLFSHCAYKAGKAWTFIILMAGTGAVQGSAKWWGINHRAHHRYTDTDRDPYNANRGFFYSHIGWMIFKLDWNRIGRVEADDLKNSKLLRWQHKYYLPLAVLMALLLPAAVAHYGWGDFWGGLYLAGIMRLFVTQHSTFCVNSLAHYLGEKSFDDVLSPCDSLITALLTFGEGYHNFHHEFPNDYRNAIRWWQFDPTKWTIKALSWVGMVSDLKKFDDNVIQAAKLSMKQRQLDAKKRKINWGVAISTLPVWTRAQFEKEAKKDGALLIEVSGLVHDVADFMSEHPGGERLLKLYNGKDATKAFNGGSYNHTTAARNLTSHLRVARIHADDLKKQK